MVTRPISIHVFRPNWSIVQQKKKKKTGRRHNDGVINIRFLLFLLSLFLFFFCRLDVFQGIRSSREESSTRVGGGWGREVVAIIVITITPVINDSEDSFFDCYALYLIIPWRREREREREREGGREASVRMTTKSGVRRHHPSVPLAALLNVFQVFSCAQQSWPDNRRVTRCPLSW